MLQVKEAIHLYSFNYKGNSADAMLPIKTILQGLL